MRKLTLVVALLGIGLSACAMDADVSPDGELEEGVVPGGKADGSDFSACEFEQAVGWVNGGVSAADMVGAGVHSRAATGIAATRDGTDRTFGTADDRPYADIYAIDRVRWVGRAAIRQLVDAVSDRCAAPGATRTEVVFSPRDYADSHLTRIAALIDGAERSIDIAMYSFSDVGVRSAMERALARGVTIRMVFESANEHRADPDGTMSAALEDIGIEVRWINKIMHHKFAIIDGARQSLDQAAGATLVSGSGNWSNGAATRYDENTVIVRGNAELALRFQREFNHLWDNGRAFVRNESIAPVEAIAIAETDIVEDPSVDAFFTSANFTVAPSASNGPTFSVTRGSNEVADQLVALIAGAERSIRIASGHLRSRPVAEALIAARQRNPALDIRVYLDGQEYISASTHAQQERDLSACLASATTDAARSGCLDRGFLFAYQVHAAGIPVRFKYYAYRWDFSYALQMHHKYMIIDEEIVVTGSYNLSDNAEHATMENVMVFRGDAHRALIDAFVDNFDEMWVTGEADGLYDALMSDVADGGAFPIVFAPMALSYEQVNALKTSMYDHCPQINSPEYRSNAAAHRACE